MARKLKSNPTILNYEIIATLKFYNKDNKFLCLL